MDISNRKYALGFLFLMVSLLQAVQGRAQNPGDLFVAERDLPNSCGGLFRYGRSSDGTILPRSRILISDFCNSAQGPLGVNPSDVVVDPFAANNLMLVIDPDAGANGKGILFDVRINDGQRFVLSDFGDPSQGPLGIDPTALVAVPNGGIFVLDKNNTLFPDGSASGGGRVFRLENYSFRTIYSELEGVNSREPTSISYDKNSKVFLIRDSLGGPDARGSTIGIRDAFNGTAPFGPFFVARQADGAYLVPGTASGSGFSGSWDFLRQSCRHSGGSLRCRLYGRLIVTNPGTRTAAHSTIRYYLSTDNQFDPFDQAVAESDVRPLRAGASRRENIRIDVAQSASGKFLIAALDANNDVAEINEDNNLVVSEIIP